MIQNQIVEAPPLGRRAASKARTRKTVLEAAKRLFMAHGYEGATIRDIAAEAGLSTGAVFANFTDKADLFNEVMLTDFQRQFERMQEVLSADAPLKDALLTLFNAGYEFHLSQLPLLRAGLSVSWSQGLEGELGDRPARATVTGLMAEMFRKAIDKGELKGGFDIDLVTQMIWDCYIANYRQAVFANWDLKALNNRLASQVDVILAGIRAR